MDINTRTKTQEIVVNIENERGEKDSFSLIFHPEAFGTQNAVAYFMKEQRRLLSCYEEAIRNAKNDEERGWAYIGYVTSVGGCYIEALGRMLPEGEESDRILGYLNCVPIETLARIYNAVADAAIKAMTASLREGKVDG